MQIEYADSYAAPFSQQNLLAVRHRQTPQRARRQDQELATIVPYRA